jgi:sec-independent protein translocase protein TatA
MGDALAPWHIIILLVVLVLLFGSRRLPGAAKSLGDSMHIFKKSVQGMHAEDDPAAANLPVPQVAAKMAAPPAGAVPPAYGVPTVPAAENPVHHQQVLDLQRQIEELRRQSAMTNGTAPVAPGAPAPAAPPL